LTWQAVSAAVLDLVLGVEGIANGAGTALDYQPEIADHPTLAAYLKDIESGKKRLNLWIVERTGLSSLRGGRGAGLPLGYGQYEDTFTITGFYNFTGRASYVSFQDLTERVVGTLLTNISLGSPNLDWNTAPPSVRLSYTDFGQIYCHTAEITLTVRRPVSIDFA